MCVCNVLGSISRLFALVFTDIQGINSSRPGYWCNYVAHLKLRQCNEPCSRSGGQKRAPPAVRELPSRWYTLLALPFPDQQVGRREIARAHRHAHRAGHFSNPL